MIIQQIRNATILVEYAGTSLLFDPWLDAKGSCEPFESPWPERNRLRSPLVDLPLSAEEILKRTDAAVLTHLHTDHFSAHTASLMPADLPIYVQDDQDAQTVSGMGFADVRVMRTEGTRVGQLTLTCVPAQHGLTPQADVGPACGVVLSSPDEPTAYIAGDTVWYEGVAETIERYRPQVIVLNCCGAATAHRGRIIMDEEDVLAVCKAAPNARVIASHMDAVNHGNVSREYLRAFVDFHGVGEQVLIPADGEVLQFS